MVKRHSKGSDGKYHIDGKKFDQLVGSRAQVFHGSAYKTSSSAAKPKGDALTRKHLKQNKHGRIVSKKKHHTAKREKRLVKAGYLTKKGVFGFMKKGKTMKKKSRKTRGRK